MTGRVCVIGGGISGLCVAYGLRHSGLDVVLFEKGSEAGGNIKTEFRDGFLIEHGPNSTLASPELLDLIRSLGLSNEIAIPDKNSTKRYILRNGKLASLPAGIAGLISTQAFSTSGKARLLAEPFIRSKSAEGESVAAFFERRFGDEIMKYAVDPFVSGIYAGDPQKLSIRHAFPRLFDLEQDSGSVIKGALFSGNHRASQMPKGTPRSITFRKGMQTLTDAMQRSLGSGIRLRTGVVSIRANAGKGVWIDTGSGDEFFDSVVLCTPADVAARLMQPIDSELAAALSHIYYPPVAVVYTGFGAGQVGRDVRGFGFLVPASECRGILGSLWTSSVFQNRAPDDHHLFTTFIGGSRNAELVSRTDDELKEIAVNELASILNIRGLPKFSFVKKWPKAIPQYNVGYERVVEKIDSFRSDNSHVFFCSNFRRGISVSDCVKNGAATARQIIDLLTLR